MATVESGQGMDQADVLNIKEAERVNNSNNFCESATLTRLQELQVKRGTTRYECYAGSQRRLVNQQNWCRQSLYVEGYTEGGI
jgi:hypothetical protein